MRLPSAILLLAAPAAARVGEVERKLKLDSSTCEFNGNGFPQGKAEFKLNVLGRDMDKYGPPKIFNNNGDRTMIVPMNDKTKILLLNGSPTGDEPLCDECKHGSDYCVVDADATDDGEASICVADPFPVYSDPCDGTNTAVCDEPATYAIFVRTVGGGSVSTDGLCVEVTGGTGDDNVGCYVDSVQFSSRKATDMSQELLTTCLGKLKVGLFDEICQDSGGTYKVCEEGDTELDEQYFWTYDNDNNRMAQFWFFDTVYLNSLVDPAYVDTCNFAVTRGGAQC